MLSLSANISSDPQSEKVDLIITVKPEFHFLRYGKKVPANGIPISYVGIPELSEDNILLQHKGGFGSNTDEYLGEIASFSATKGQFYTRVLDFLLTDISQEDPDFKQRPLWYYHTLTDYDGEFPTEVSGIRVLDRNMNSAPSSRWKEITETDSISRVTKVKIYHDLEHKEGEGIDNFEVYYVTYRDAKNYSHFSILHSNRVFQRVRDFGLIRNLSSKTYAVAGSSAGGGTFEVTTHYLTDRLWFKPLRSGQIRAYPPERVGNSSSWELKFSNGGFFAEIDSDIHSYFLPEFYSQAFHADDLVNATRWSSSVGDEEGIVLNSRVIRTRLYPILTDTNNIEATPTTLFPLRVVVLDEDGTFIDGFTNQSSEQYWRNPKTELDYFLKDFTQIPEFTFDAATGFIRLPIDLKSTYKVLIHHKFSEQFLRYDDLELNPVLNRSILDKKIVFYLNPFDPTNFTYSITWDINAKKGLYHLVVDTDDTILDWPKNTDGTAKDSDLEGLIGNISGGFTTLSGFETLFPSKLIVTHAFVGLFKDPEDLVLTDVRIRGGGIRKDLDLDQLVEGHPELLFVNDYAGKPLGLGGGVLVEIPNSLRKVGGGTLADDHIESLVKRHLPLGHYPVIQYYGNKPVINEVYSEFNGVQISWSYTGDFDTFNIYLLGDENDSTLLSDGITEHTKSLAISAQPNNRFRLYVAPVLDGIEGLASDPVLVMNFDG